MDRRHCSALSISWDLYWSPILAFCYFIISAGWANSITGQKLSGLCVCPWVKQPGQCDLVYPVYKSDQLSVTSQKCQRYSRKQSGTFFSDSRCIISSDWLPNCHTLACFCSNSHVLSVSSTESSSYTVTMTKFNISYIAINITSSHIVDSSRTSLLDASPIFAISRESWKDIYSVNRFLAFVTDICTCSRPCSGSAT